MSRIAIVGMACRYPDATSPKELWENAIAGRRAFRRLPDVRMRLEDYWDSDPSAPDRFYSSTAAVIEGYEFDRARYHIAGSTYRSTDLTHWLALDTASRALADAGFVDADGLPLERTGVVVGNTLTGEFTRANVLRLRWPYVRRTVAGTLKEKGWDEEELAALLDELEQAYKAPFPAPNEDTLAGGLSNTIAGRICNYYDFKGGGYSVDGACSSSLLSVATGCKALLDGDLDAAVVGGVDLSIDPFEIIGFAKTGALAKGEMRIYDRECNGFWPGEGCGMVVLMRETDAIAANRRIYATIPGWGISSDGKGGITRPELAGHQLALRRAYERAGFGIDTVPMFEGHGTGTAVGDVTELRAIAGARAAADPAAAPAAISSVKGMIGHTKAAAGIAGLIKATMAVHHQVLPPTVGCVDPHPVLEGEAGALRVLRTAEPWPAGAPVRAGVSAMGFGGINTHVVLEQAGRTRRPSLDPRSRSIAASVQDAELLLIDGGSPRELRERIAELADFVPQLSMAELSDLAGALGNGLRHLPYRAAVVVRFGTDAERGLRRLLAALDAGETSLFADDGLAFLDHATGPGRIGLLFPGQGSGRGTSGGALRRRFPEVAEAYARATLPTAGDMVATDVAQPRIVTGSTAAVRALSILGIDATVAVGHSLGELSALQWAGAMDEQTLLRVASTRGATMRAHSASGTMASLAAAPEAVIELIGDLPVVVACYNGPEQTVVAGSVDAVEALERAARAAGVTATRLPVSHAFHSPLVAPAAAAFRAQLDELAFDGVDRQVVSTVTGEVLPSDADIHALLQAQITAPVLFTEAVAVAAKGIDLWVEAGPGRVLSALAAETTAVPAVSLDTDDESAASLLRVVGAAYVVGCSDAPAAILHGRLFRPIEIGKELSFFANPCEQAPSIEVRGGTGAATVSATAAGAMAGAMAGAVAGANPGAPTVAEPAGGPPAEGPGGGLELLRRLTAERTELPMEMLHPGSRLLDDLHLSSITVGQIVNQAAQHVGIPPSRTPTNFATATLGELAETLDALAELAQPAEDAGADQVAGAAAWARAFAVDRVELPVPARSGHEGDGAWRALATDGHPLAEPLRAALQRAGVGGGVLVCLPPQCAPDDLRLALEGAQAALTAPAGTRFVLVQQGQGAAGLARTLHLEAPQLRTTVVHLPAGAPDADRMVTHVVAEVAGTLRFSEAHYDEQGLRRVPTLRAMPVRPARRIDPLGSGDVLLVTGGGKGITAESALALAGDAGAKVAVLGRSDPATDDELAANLRRMAEAGLTVRYARADVTDATAVRAAVEELTGALGPVTALLHGAGRNEPGGLAALAMDDLRRTFAPKVDGLRNVLDAVDKDRLRLLVTFGSIIGRAGLSGEAHYATANEWLADLTQEMADRYPDCRCLCVEWSVWSGVGMGERLSVVESLNRQGVTAVTPDQGVAILRRLVTDPDAPVVTVVSGRTEGVGTVRYDVPELPLLRFVERVLLRYHGVELVAEVELSAGTDLYLPDHHLDGNMLFPAVFGMEAMVQVATAVTGRTDVPVIERAEFLRPIVVMPGGSTTVRIAAVVVDDDRVAVTIRSAETAFAAEHFRAQVVFGDRAVPAGPPDQIDDGVPAVPLDPLTEMYGGVLFQGPRFERLRRYHRAAARHVDAVVATTRGTDWFAGYLPGRLLLGDPGMRDALMHGNQVCVPDATLLPEGIDRVHPAGAAIDDEQELRYCATERSQDGDLYTYDIAVRTRTGDVVERWEGLRLRAVRRGDGRGPWVPALLGPYLERWVGTLLGTSVAVVVEPDGADPGGSTLEARRSRTALAAARTVGRPVTVRYRPDGRPEIDGPLSVSAAHGASVTLCVAAAGTVGCDAETVKRLTPATWSSLLGRHEALADLVAMELGEDPDAARTRVWGALESLQKAGLTSDAPLDLRPDRRPGWAVFASGALLIATALVTLREATEPAVFVVLAEGRD
ncbi:MAG: SDR family NAD(P)-dependent oxidoreductase [Frankiaceae bacterium]